jgi:hypothetical protein
MGDFGNFVFSKLSLSRKNILARALVLQFITSINECMREVNPNDVVKGTSQFEATSPNSTPYIKSLVQNAIGFVLNA